MYKVNKKAFTLVEILITLAVMSVLLIVLISNVDSATDKARKTASLTDIRSLQYAVLQVANQDKELTNDLNALADLLNKNLDTELTVVVENNKLKTYSTDAWGNSYQLRYSRPSNTNGQIQILSAGPDGKFETQDDIITGVVCQQLGSGTSVVVKDTVNLDEVIPDNLDPSTQTGHTCVFNQVVQTEQYLQTPGNCAIPAMYYYSCTCGNSGHTTFSGLKDPNVHIANQTYKYESVNNTEHVKIYMCSECQTILNTVVEEHNFKDDDCTKCNYDPHTHVYTEQIMSNEYQKSPATCTSPAVYYYLCTCGAKGTQTYTHGDKLEHEYIQTISKYPSCTQKGTYLYTCNSCNNSYTEDIAMYAHSYVKENTSNQYLQTNATCKYPAKYFYTCECGDIGTNTFEYGDVDENNHAYTTGIDYEIFNNEDHYINTVCNGCHATINSTKGNHVLNEQNTCKLCNSHLHVFDQQNNNYLKDNATCTTKATYFYECVCGEPGTEYYEFGALNLSNHTGAIVNVGTKDVHSQYSCCKTTSSSEHEYVISVEKAATCTEKGINKYTCACGYVYTDQNIDMIAHKYVENVVSIYLKSQATCTSKAIYYKTCICGKQNGETFEYGEMLSHTPINGGTSAIHTKCNVCNTTISSTHNYNSQIITNATCQTVGKQQKICACGYSYYEEIAKTSHIDADNNMFCDNCNIRTGYAAYTLVFQSNGNASYYGSTNKVTRTFTGWMNTEYSSSSKTPWYSLRSTIKEIIIEDGVNPTSTKYWFQNFSALETLIIGNDMTTISYGICWNSSLKNLTIGQGVTTIESSAFYGCTDLISINFNATEITNEIGQTTFYQAGREGSGVTVTIGKNVTKIPNNMFSYGNSLSSANNINIKTLTFEEGSQCTYIGDLAFAYNEKMTSAILPNNITYIGKKAFDGCSSLKQIVIPECVEFIGEDAYSNCKQITSIQYNAIQCADLELMNGVFRSAGRSSTGITVTIGENVITVPAFMFKPENQTKTSPKITTVTFKGNKVKNINSNAFAYLIELRSIELPEKLSYIGSAAFNLCKLLTEVTIPESVSYIGSGAFSSCKNLTTIYYNAKTTNDIESNWGMPFGGCGSNYDGFDLIIGNNVEYIGNYIFSSGTIKSLTLNSTKLQTIGSYAFKGQKNLTEITLPKSLQLINPYAFSGCTGLTKVVFENIYGWQVNYVDIDVSSPTNNVTLLTSTYVGKAIKCPAPPDTTLDNYTWAELKEIAQLKLTASQYESRYGIKLGQKKDGKYVLVDLDGNNYGGFVFMYDTGLSEKMNSSMSNYGGYRSSSLLSKVNNLYTNMTDTELKNAIKQVTIKTSSPSGSTLVTNNYSCYMFLASYIEVGGTDALNDVNEGSGLRAEGSIFDFFQNNDNRLYVCHRDWWWTRSVDPDSGYAAFRAVTNEGQTSGYANPSYAKAVVATFVIG